MPVIEHIRPSHGMRTIVVIGIGVGDPDQLTLAGAAALASADVLLTVEHRATIAELEVPRRAIRERHTPRVRREVRIADDERGREPVQVSAWRARRGRRLAEAIASLGDDETAAILAWGDPSLYDGTLDAAAARAPPFAVRVVPGVSAPQALAARHGIALTRVGHALTILPGRLLADGAAPEGDLVVMLDPGCAFLAHPNASIHWGAS
jgi:precorrin-6A synthase